jgi:O-antigen/teichoic acid export membrane protein
MLAFCLCVFGCLFVYIYSSEIVNILTGSEFTQSADLLKIFSLLPLVIYTSSYYGLVRLFAAGKQSTFNLNLRLASIVAIFSSVPFVWFGGLHGAIFLVVLIEILVMTLMIRSNSINE